MTELKKLELTQLLKSGVRVCDILFDYPHFTANQAYSLKKSLGLSSNKRGKQIGFMST